MGVAGLGTAAAGINSALIVFDHRPAETETVIGHYSRVIFGVTSRGVVGNKTGRKDRVEQQRFSSP
jgi:hypothetical protein